MGDKPGQMYTRAQAILIGAREICREEGHQFKLPDLTTTRGGVQGVNAVCDGITCRRCDVAFTATYPPIGDAS